MINEELGKFQFSIEILSLKLKIIKFNNVVLILCVSDEKAMSM